MTKLMHNNLTVDTTVTSRIKIQLETQTDVITFVNLATRCPSDMILNIVDDNGMCINARSLLGCMYAQEFKHMWLVSNSDKIHTIFADYIRN